MPSLSTTSRAPPRSTTIGRPPASLRTSTSRADAAPPAGADGLEHGLLGGPAAGKMLGGHLAALAILDFVLGIDPADELLGVPLDHLRNPQTLDDVGADANDVDHETSRVKSGSTAAGGPPGGRRSKVPAGLAVSKAWPAAPPDRSHDCGRSDEWPASIERPGTKPRGGGGRRPVRRRSRAEPSRRRQPGQRRQLGAVLDLREVRRWSRWARYSWPSAANSSRKRAPRPHRRRPTGARDTRRPPGPGPVPPRRRSGRALRGHGRQSD